MSWPSITSQPPTLEELFLSAEYIMSEGTYAVVLCERGVRTFADHTRNTLDIGAVPAIVTISDPLISAIRTQSA